MKKSLMLVAVFACLTAHLNANDVKVERIIFDTVHVVPSKILYPVYASQLAGAFYALKHIAELLAMESPTIKNLEPKRALAIQLERKEKEDKAWAGIGLLLAGTVGQIVAGMLTKNGIQYKSIMTVSKA